jgi:hypothetical protein
MTRVSSSSWWTPAPSVVSYLTVQRRRRPARRSPTLTGPPLSGADGKVIPCWGRIHRRRLARPPYMGDALHLSLIQGGQRVFTSRGPIRLTTDPARPVHQHRRVAVAVFPQRPTDHHGRPPATADAAQLSASSINTTGGAPAGPLRAGPPTVHSRRCPRSTTDLTICWSSQHISFS